MYRSGMSLPFRAIVVGAVLLVVGVVVLQGFRGGHGEFNLFTRDNVHSSDINTCESRVQGFCQQSGNDGKDWGMRYPNCQEFADVIDSGDTSCPLEPAEGASTGAADDDDDRVAAVSADDIGGVCVEDGPCNVAPSISGEVESSECQDNGFTCAHPGIVAGAATESRNYDCPGEQQCYEFLSPCVQNGYNCIDPRLARETDAETQDYACDIAGTQCYAFPDEDDQAIDLPHGLLLTSHRGGMDIAPENTVMAIERSRELGMHGVEIDVRPAADGIVVFHDKKTGRVADEDVKVASTPVSHLTEILVEEGLEHLRDDYPEEMATIPEIAEVLDRYQDTDIVFRIEFKGDIRSDADLGREVYEMVEERGMVDQVIFMSFEGSCSLSIPFTGRNCDWEGLEGVESASNGRATTAVLWQKRKDPRKQVKNAQKLEIADVLDEAEGAFDIVVARDGDNGLGGLLTMGRDEFARRAENKGLDIAFMGAGWETPVIYGAEWLSTNDPERLADWARNNREWIRDSYDTWDE